MQRQLARFALLIFLLELPYPARAEPAPGAADDLVQRIESVLRGDTAVMKVSM